MRTLGMAVVAVAIVPGFLLAQADSSRMRARDSTRGRRQQTAAGEVSHRGNYGLTRDQITQLQTALRQDDCDPGAIDGVLGPRTRRAMACARRKNNVTGNNPNDLFRSLNLSFTTSDSTGMGGVMRSGARRGRGMGRDSTMRMNDTSMSRSRGRRGMGRDSTRRPTTRPDTSRRP